MDSVSEYTIVQNTVDSEFGHSAGGIALALSGGNDHPTFALWPVDLRDALRAFLGSGAKASIRAFADARGAARADFPDDGAFANLNTRDDLARAEALLAKTRQTGPERIMALARERAPQGFTHVHDVISREELEEIAAAVEGEKAAS